MFSFIDFMCQGKKAFKIILALFENVITTHVKFSLCTLPVRTLIPTDLSE